MKVVVINGAAGAGKDLFVLCCSMYLGADNLKNYSTVTYVKAVAASLGWDGIKTPKNRKFLSDLKDLLTQWDDIPYRKTAIEIEMFRDDLEFRGVENGVIFVHCREPEEIQRFKDEFNAHTLLIRREQAEGRATSNHADQNVLEYDYDTTIYNNGTIEELVQCAKIFLTENLGMNL